MKKLFMMLCFCSLLCTTAFAEEKEITLAGNDGAIEIVVDKNDNQTVRLAADLFAADIERVSGKLPQIRNQVQEGTKTAVIIGSIGESGIIQDLIRRKKINVSEVKGKWEAAVTEIVEQPCPGVEKALVIAGSDRRGTAFAVLDISKKIGVSPWYWFADVHPEKKDRVSLTLDRTVQKTPSVQYRGIFINDEMWGIRPWAYKTHAPQEGKGIGPTTYARIFELLLRLKANCIWPAMHQQTRPFNVYPENKLVADKYAIVMGTSHCEPMLRNSIAGAEWDREFPGEDYDYVKNRDKLYTYWENALKSNGKYENIYTLGKRHKDDGPAPEVNVEVLNEIIKDQRQMIRDHVNKDVTKVPQMMIFYTEVLDLYNKGAKIPDDVIFCWPDDNFGNMRQLPDAKEQKRSGGSGVYYHFQWINGATSAYPWLNTSPLGLTWYEMKKAYDYNARKFWIVNVGDIKPYEISIDHFLSMAWDITKFEKNDPRGFLKEWATYNFGAEYADEIAEIWLKHTELGYARRPDHMISFQGRSKKHTYDWFSTLNYNDEAQRRVDQYEELAEKAEALYARLPEQKKDAFFEMVLYNVKGAALHNKKVIYAQKSLQYGKEFRPSAATYAAMAQFAENDIKKMIDHYNYHLETVGAKWNYMASVPGPWGYQWEQWAMPPLSTYSGEGIPELRASLEEGRQDTLPTLSVFNRDRRFIDLFNKGNGCVYWSSRHPEWIKLSEEGGKIWDEKRIWVEVDWNKAPKGADINDEIIFDWYSSNDSEWISYEELDPARQKQYREGTLSQKSGPENFAVKVNVFNPAMNTPVKGFVESNGYISMEAENFSRKNDTDLASWEILEGLGRTGNSVTVLPTTIPAVTAIKDIIRKSPSLEYDIYTFSTGKASMILNCAASIPINKDYKLRYAYSIDGGDPIIPAKYIRSGRSASNNLLFMENEIGLPAAGQHTLKIWLVDPSVVIDKIIINTGGIKKSYLGPLESVYHK